MRLGLGLWLGQQQYGDGSPSADSFTWGGSFAVWDGTFLVWG